MHRAARDAYVLVSTVIAAASVVISLLLSPETKGKVLVSDLVA